ncbi:DUF7144 family membrane protein [Streptomyces sp. NPDC002004]
MSGISGGSTTPTGDGPVGTPNAGGTSPTATTRPGHGAPVITPAPSGGGWSAGGTAFAGVVMMVIGIIGIFEGIAAIAQDDVYSRLGQYTFKFSLTGWGWIHLIIGILVLLVGGFILKGADWARATGVGLTCLYVIAQFVWLPYQPVWSIIAIFIGIFVIWALCADTGRGRTV